MVYHITVWTHINLQTDCSNKGIALLYNNWMAYLPWVYYQPTAMLDDVSDTQRQLLADGWNLDPRQLIQTPDGALSNVIECSRRRLWNNINPTAFLLWDIRRHSLAAVIDVVRRQIISVRRPVGAVGKIQYLYSALDTSRNKYYLVCQCILMSHLNE